MLNNNQQYEIGTKKKVWYKQHRKQKDWIEETGKNVHVPNGSGKNPLFNKINYQLVLNPVIHQ